MLTSGDTYTEHVAVETDVQQQDVLPHHTLVQHVQLKQQQVAVLTHMADPSDNNQEQDIVA